MSLSDNLVKWQCGLQSNTIGHEANFHLPSNQYSQSNLDRVLFAILVIFSRIKNIDHLRKRVESKKPCECTHQCSVALERYCSYAQNMK